MATRANNDARIDFRLPSELKGLIEQAASALGQSVSDFALGILTRHAREVLHEQNVTELTNRDRDIFIALLEDTDAKPNRALCEAASKYGETFD